MKLEAFIWWGSAIAIAIVAFMFYVLSVCKLANAAEPITDPKIVGIAIATDNVQIEGSRYSYPLIEYVDLKNFANFMIIDYENYKQTILDVAQRQQIPIEDSEFARDVLARGQVALKELKKLQGRDLEKRYAEYEIELHEKTITTIDKVFLPNVENQELEKLIGNLRPIVMGRLDWAKRIRGMYP